MKDFFAVRSAFIVKFFPFFAFFVCVFLLWPGLMRPDSIIQMQQGITGIFSDFHPPMMGVIWRIFSGLYIGPGVLFILHLALYWGAVALFGYAQLHRAHWVYIIAFLPPVFAYQLLVIKDVSFVNAYLFCAAWLHFYSMRNVSPRPLSLFGWFLVAFYGTCVVHQAIIVLPWLCVWFAKFYWPRRAKEWIMKGFILFVVLAAGVEIFNRTMAVSSNRSQHNKLYDLAGISVNLGDSVFPEYIKQYKLYNFERIKNLYNPNRVDDLVFISDSPLPTSSSAENLKSLNSAWISAIFSYPIAYLKHRWNVFYKQLTVSLLKHPADIKGESTPEIRNILNWAENAGIFTCATWLMAYIGYFLIQFLYMYKGYKHFGENPKYTSLFFQNMMGLTLVSSLFFIASAAEARYAYLAIAMFYFSHPFVFNE